MNRKKKTLDSDELQAQLTYLNLFFMQQNFEALASQAATAQWSHVEFLRRLIQGETAARHDRATLRRIQNARFPVVKTLEQFNFTWPEKINRLQIQDYFRLKFVEDKGNVIFIGTVGLGKTHLSIALGYAACMAGYEVRYSTAINIINHLSTAQQNGCFAKELRKYLKFDVLIMDELGYLPIDKHGADILFQVISQRYERGSIILSTNKTFKNWPSTFNNDSTLTSAILDRILHHANTSIVEGKSYRMKDRIEP